MYPSVDISWLYFFTQVIVFLVLGMLGDFHFYSGHLSIMLGDPGSCLNFLFYQEVTPIKFSTKVVSTFVGCGPNDNLLCRAFAVTILVCFAIWCSWGSHWSLPVLSNVGRSYPRQCCLVPLGEKRKVPSCWDEEYFLGALQEGRVLSACFIISGLLIYPSCWCFQLACYYQQNSHSVMGNDTPTWVTFCY